MLFQRLMVNCNGTEMTQSVFLQRRTDGAGNWVEQNGRTNKEEGSPINSLRGQFIQSCCFVPPWSFVCVGLHVYLTVS